MILTNRNIYLSILALLPLLPLHPLMVFVAILAHCFTKNLAVNQFCVQLLLLTIFKAIVILVFTHQCMAALIDILFVYSSMMILLEDEVFVPWLSQTCSHLTAR